MNPNKVNGIIIPEIIEVNGKEIKTHPFKFTTDGKAILLTFKQWRDANPEPATHPAKEYNATSKVVGKDEIGDGKSGRVSMTVAHAKKGKASEYEPFLKARFTWKQSGPIAEVSVKVRKAMDAQILALPLSQLETITRSLDLAFLSRIITEVGGIHKPEDKTPVKELLIAHCKLAKVKGDVSIESALLAIKADTEVKEAKDKLRKAEKEVKEKEVMEARIAKRSHSKTHVHKAVMHAKEDTTIPSMSEKEMKEWARTHKPRKAANAKRSGKVKVKGITK